MPNYYEAPAEQINRIFPKAIAENLIGGSQQNVAKSFMPDRALAAILARIANHYKRLGQKLIILHEIETRTYDPVTKTTLPGEVLTFEEATELYPSVRTWKECHDWLIEHLGALQGFVTKAAVRAEMLRENENKPMVSAIPDSASRPANGGAQQNGGGQF